LYISGGVGADEHWDIVGTPVELGPTPYPLIPCASASYDKGTYSVLTAEIENLNLITRFYIPMVNRKFDIPRVSTLDPNIS
jgi:hypothetical protein